VGARDAEVVAKPWLKESANEESAGAMECGGPAELQGTPVRKMKIASK